MHLNRVYLRRISRILIVVRGRRHETVALLNVFHVLYNYYVVEVSIYFRRHFDLL